MAKSEAPAAPAPATKTVTLTQSHEHGGRDYAPGHTLTLAAKDADWLIAIGRAEPAAK